MRFVLISLLGILSSCNSINNTYPNKVIVSIKDQKASIINCKTHKAIKQFPVSTGRGGVGNKPGSNQTPTGLFKIVKEVGEGLAVTTGYKANIPTKNIKRNDPIVSRVICIEGLEQTNRNSASRNIKIHGTPFVHTIGKPVSMGCVRFKPNDIAILCYYIKEGDLVEIR